MARKVAKRAKRAPAPKKQERLLKHIKLPNEVFEALQEAMTPKRSANGAHKPDGEAFITLSRLDVGESHVTSLSPLSFNQARKRLKNESNIVFISKGGRAWFSREIAPIDVTVFTRLR